MQNGPQAHKGATLTQATKKTTYLQQQWHSHFWHKSKLMSASHRRKQPCAKLVVREHHWNVGDAPRMSDSTNSGSTGSTEMSQHERSEHQETSNGANPKLAERRGTVEGTEVTALGADKIPKRSIPRPRSQPTGTDLDLEARTMHSRQWR